MDNGCWCQMSAASLMYVSFLCKYAPDDMSLPFSLTYSFKDPSIFRFDHSYYTGSLCIDASSAYPVYASTPLPLVNLSDISGYLALIISSFLFLIKHCELVS